MDINNDGLESALNNTAAPTTPSEQPAQNISPDQEIGYHQGALNTLVNERNELIKMAQVVESLMQAHMKRLEELGVKIPTQ